MNVTVHFIEKQYILVLDQKGNRLFHINRLFNINNTQIILLPSIPKPLYGAWEKKYFSICLWIDLQILSSKYINAYLH